MKPPEDRQARSRLALHLGVLLLLKFAVLVLLWFYLVAPYRIDVDAPAMEQRLMHTSPQSTIPTKEAGT